MKDGVSIKRAICNFCASGCAVLIHVKDGRIIKIDGNPEHPISRGYICQRIGHAIKWLYHPEQLNTPSKELAREVKVSGKELLGRRHSRRLLKNSVRSRKNTALKLLRLLKGPYGEHSSGCGHASSSCSAIPTTFSMAASSAP